MSEELQVASERPALNESAIREHALRCSKLYRAGKFTRVGQDFLDEVYADVECIIRKLRDSHTKTLHATLEPVGSFTKGALLDKVGVELDRAIARLIQNKTQSQPTVGVTLGRTR